MPGYFSLSLLQGWNKQLLGSISFISLQIPTVALHSISPKTLALHIPERDRINMRNLLLPLCWGEKKELMKGLFI